MARKFLVCAIMTSFIALLLSCEKLPETQTNSEGTIKMEVAQLGDAIPLEWGNIITVSSVGQFPGWVQVWFQDKDGAVYMVPYNVASNTFHANYRFLKRK